LVRPTKDEDGRDAFPSYSVVNDENYSKYKQDDSEPKLFVIKATKELNNTIAVNALTQMSSSKIKFLIDEKMAKLNLDKKLESDGKKMTMYERSRRLKPHILTSGLKEEMLNLRQKVNVATLGASLISLEQTNRKLHKDKYSAFAYGLYWIKLTDDSRKSYKQANRFKSSMLYSSNFSK